MRFTKIVDQDVSDKFMLSRFRAEFPQKNDVCVIFMCTSDNAEADEDIIMEDGLQVIAIHVHYTWAKEKDDIFEDLVAMVRERLRREIE